MNEPTKPAEDIFEERCHPSAVTGGPFKFAEPHWMEGDVCSHCGGVRPSIILKAIAAGAEVIPTDKAYKIYVELPEAKPEEIIIVGTANFKPDHGDYVQATPDIIAKYGAGRQLTPEHYVQLRPRGPFNRVKCYTNHFSEAQALEFVRLVETGKMKIGHPGQFYRPLAFGRYRPAIEKLLAELRPKA